MTDLIIDGRTYNDFSDDTEKTASACPYCNSQYTHSGAIKNQVYIYYRKHEERCKKRTDLERLAWAIRFRERQKRTIEPDLDYLLAIVNKARQNETAEQA